MTHLKDNRIVITGAGSGLGRAIALRFAREGWRIAIADINEQGATETLKLVTASGGSGFVQTCNVREATDFETLAQRLQQEWGGVDVIVNNAGIASAGTVVESRYSDWDTTLDINLMGVVRGCRELVPLLLAQGAGHVVNTASFAAIATPPSMAAYNVSKAAVVALSESLRAEVIDAGVDVSVACPSFFKTNLTESMISPDPAMKRVTEMIMERMTVSAEDVADDIYTAVMKRRFMVITHKDARMQWRMKRAAPELFYKMVRERVKPRFDMLRRKQAKEQARASNDQPNNKE